MALTSEDIRAIVAAFEASDWTDLSLQHGDTRLELSRTGGPPARSAAPPVATPVATPVAPQPAAVAAAPADAAPAAPAPPAPEAGTAAPAAAGSTGGAGPSAGAASSGGITVAAPTVGLFWRSPQPGAPPFVEVGQRVEPDDTVCIVEVMKLMNHVKAGVAGTVVAVPVENGAMVEHGDTLVVIDAAG